MRFSNYTGFRLFTPKYAQTRIRLISVAGGLFVLSWFIGEPAKAWVDGMALLAVIASQVVLLVGMIAERKGW